MVIFIQVAHICMHLRICSLKSGCTNFFKKRILYTPMYVETNGYNKEEPMLAISSIAIGIIFTTI